MNHDDAVDEYGNPLDGSSLPYCCFPDCGCDGARNCMAESGASFGSHVLNREQGAKGGVRAAAEPLLCAVRTCWQKWQNLPPKSAAHSWKRKHCDC